MDFFFNTLKKILTLTVSIVFALVVLYVPQQYGSHKTVPTVEAFPVVEVGPNVVTNTIRTVKETVLDRIGWMLAKAVVSNIMASTIDWVNSGFRGSPAFVQDLDRFLLNVADEAAGRVLEEFGGEFSFICSPFRLDIQVALALQYQQAREGLPYQGCLLSEAFENFEDFVAGDFLQGGWQDWMQISANPNMYSQYGAYLEAQTTFEARIRNAEGRESQLLDFGKGFLSSKQCETVTGPDGEGVENCRIVTPGQTIADRLNTSLGLGEQQLIAADEIDELIGALVGQIAVKALQGTAGLLGLSANVSGSSYPGFDAASYTQALRNEGSNSLRNTLNDEGGTLQNTLDTQIEYRDMASELNREGLTLLGSGRLSDSERNIVSEVVLQTDRAVKQANENIQALETKITEYEALDREYDNPATDNQRKDEINSELQQILLSVVRGTYYTETDLIGDKQDWEDALTL